MTPKSMVMSAGILARLPFNGSAERLKFAASSIACGQMTLRGDCLSRSS